MKKKSFLLLLPQISISTKFRLPTNFQNNLKILTPFLIKNLKNMRDLFSGSSNLVGRKKTNQTLSVFY